MNHNEDKNRRIYLYSHSPEAEKAIESGEVAISTGGARRPDGTMMDMAKPLSFTLDELKEMVSDETHLIDKRMYKDNLCYRNDVIAFKKIPRIYR